MRFSSYGGMIRAARRHADLSQRQLAAVAGVAASVISRIEAGRQFPSCMTLEKLLAATGFKIQAVNESGDIINDEATWKDQDATRDGACRRFPAHLDTREHTKSRPWWYWLRGGVDTRPPLLTFDLSRSLRDNWRRQDHRTAADPDQRLKHPHAQSRVHIPGYRPASVYGYHARM